jgi:hypothetical protein
MEHEIDPAEYLKKIFNCPADDWGAVKFSKIKEKFINLINTEDTKGILLELAKKYSNDATKYFMLEEMKDSDTSIDAMIELGNIAAMGFILMGVYYGYMLKQKELRDKPIMVDWGFLKDLKGGKKEEKEKNGDMEMV